jgi:AcrR family transcriptional regulator
MARTTSFRKHSHHHPNFKVEAKRTELIKVAYSLVVEKGFKKLRLSELAARAGISSSLLHYYFPTREALVQTLVQYLYQQFNEKRSPIFQANRDSPIHFLRCLFADLKYQMQQVPELFIVAGELELRSLHDPAIAELMRNMYLTWRATIEEALHKGVAEGSFRSDLDIQATALAITDLIKGFSYEVGTRSEVAVDRLAVQVESWLTTNAPPTLNITTNS